MSLHGITGVRGITGAIGSTGTSCPTGIRGVTGLFGTLISEDEWDNPIKTEQDGNTYFRVRKVFHCQFGPAIFNSNFQDWYIKGENLSDIQVAELKSILEDIKLAPLYLSHEVFKYTARWVLKNVGRGL